MAPSKEYPIHIDIDKGIIDDGGADDFHKGNDNPRHQRNR